MLLELYELAPNYFAEGAKLPLTPEEQSNADSRFARRSDVADAVLQTSATSQRRGARRLWRRAGAAVQGSNQSDGEIHAGVYAPDHVTSYDYAACCAKASRILAPFDKKMAAEHLDSGTRAYEWAEAHSNNDDPIYKHMSERKNAWPAWADAVKGSRLRAALELYATTKKPAYHEAFKQLTELTKPGEIRYLDQADADFTYARLPDDLADAALKKRAIELFTSYADYAIDFSKKNAFEIINGARTDLPIIGPCCYFSAPGVKGYQLVRANVLAKKPQYLAAAVQGVQLLSWREPGQSQLLPGHRSQMHPLSVQGRCGRQRPVSRSTGGLHSFRPGRRRREDVARRKRLGRAMVSRSPAAEDDS